MQKVFEIEVASTQLGGSHHSSTGLFPNGGPFMPGSKLEGSFPWAHSTQPPPISGPLPISLVSEPSFSFSGGVVSGVGNSKVHSWKRRARVAHAGVSQVLPTISTPGKRNSLTDVLEGSAGHQEKKGRRSIQGGCSNPPTLAEAVVQPHHLP